MASSQLLLLLILSFSICNSQCPIPANCDSYSVSQLKCLACQTNYILIGNTCVTLQTLSALITTTQTTTPASTPGLTIATPTQNNLYATTSQQTSAQTASSNIFVPWYSTAQTTPTASANTQNIYGFAQYTALSPTSTSTSTFNYSDSNCQTKDSLNRTCEQCYSYYYLNSTQNKCVPVNPLCRQYTN
jgi:hypothetical protein